MVRWFVRKLAQGLFWLIGPEYYRCIGDGKRIYLVHLATGRRYWFRGWQQYAAAGYPPYKQVRDGRAASYREVPTFERPTTQ